MKRYEELRTEGRINFVTFHQSYGYEDFIEGLRPEVKNGQVSYSVRPGIFREVCDAARLASFVKPLIGETPLKDRRIYKMSLGTAATNEGNLIFQDCMEKGYILLGYGGNIDFSECNTAKEIRQKVEDESRFEKPESVTRYMSLFKQDLKVGDIVVISQGNSHFRAIGEVSGEYEYLEASPTGTFHHMRAVRWLAIFEVNRKVEEIYNKKFMQSSIYLLHSEALNFNALENILNNNQKSDSGNSPFVLIIDEINRANISKVFGELITLLESDKREGQVNALNVKLPYSGHPFCVPSNLHVIGTMNTADRSIALLDTALRRRFDFEELLPEYKELPSVDGIDLGALLMQINERLEYLYDRDHTIGHAYFINIKTLEDLDTVFKRKVIPLLQEYFYEDLAKVRSVLNDKGDFFSTTELHSPIGIEGNGSKWRYTMNEEIFPHEAYLKIYQKS
jgi:5-methylcytosine-specific restriction protein B